MSIENAQLDTAMQKLVFQTALTFEMANKEAAAQLGEPGVVLNEWSEEDRATFREPAQALWQDRATKTPETTAPVAAGAPVIEDAQIIGYDRLKPGLETLGENVFHLGESGAGHTIKPINNFFAMTTATAMAEAFAIADTAGVEREEVYRVMSACPLHSGMMDFVRDYAMDRQIELAFLVANGRKHVGYFTAITEHLGQDARIGPATLTALSEAVDAGWGDRIVPEMVNYFSKGTPQ